MGIRKKLLTLTASILAVASSISPVFAKTNVYEDYDTTRKGSITLYKYINNDGVSIESTGTSLGDTSDTQLEAVQEATGNYHMLPEEGVSFMYYKIGVYTQIDDPESGKSGMYIKDLDDGFKTLLTQYGVSLEAALDNAYDLADITDALTALCKATSDTATGEEGARAYVKASGSSFESATNIYGKTVASDLEVGLYLIAEVDWEHQSISKKDGYWSRNEGTTDAGEGSEYADIVSPSSPFLVQIPMNNAVQMTSGGKTYEAGEGWIYDVTAYPKNGSLSIHKDIVVDEYSSTHNNGNDTSYVETLCDYAQTNYLNGTGSSEYEAGVDDDTKLDGENSGESLTHQIDVNMGDTVTQVISSDVPALVGEKLNKTYKITDRMTKGLVFSELKSVTLGTDVWNGANFALTKDTDYTLTVSDDLKSFTVELTSEGLAKLDNVSSASYLYILFDSVLTKDALIGTDTYSYTTNDGDTVDATNQDTAMLTYATDRTGEHDYYSNTPKVYTYELDLTKVLKEGIGHKSSDFDYSNVSYSVEGSYQDALNVDNSLNAEEKTYEDVKFIKESDGVYHIFDEVSEDANNAVTTIFANATDGTLVLKGLDSRDYRITERSTAEGYNLLAEPIYVRIVANEAANIKYEDGSLDHAYYWTGDEPVSLKKFDILNSDNGVHLYNGRAKIIVQNNGSNIFRTGGEGSYKYMLVGFGVMLVAGALYITLKRKEGLSND